MTTIHLQVEGEEIILLDVRSGRPNALAVLDAAVALDLAERLRSAASSLRVQELARNEPPEVAAVDWDGTASWPED